MTANAFLLSPCYVPEGRAIYVPFDPDIINPADAPAMMLWELPDDGDGRTERACLAALGDLVSG